MLARSFTLALALAVIAHPSAPAAPLDCNRLLESFDARAASVTEADRWGGWLGTKIHAYRRLRFGLTSWALRFARTRPEQKREACERIAAVAEREGLMYTDSRHLVRLFQKFCDHDEPSVERFTAMALGAAEKRGEYAYVHFADPRRETEWSRPIRRNVNRWLDLVVTKNWLTPESWRKLIDGQPYRAFPLMEVTDDDLTRVGLTSADTLALAKAVATRDVPFATVARVANLPRERWSELEGSLDPLQWLGYRRATGVLDETGLAAFGARLETYIPGDSYRDHRAADRTLLDLLYDVDLPYETFQKYLELAKAHWPRIYRFRLDLDFSPDHLNKRQLARAEAYFGRAIVRRHEVWRESRRFARGLTTSLRRDKFDSAARFIEAFRVERFFTETPGVANGYTTEGYYETMAVAEQYFKILRKRLPEFFALNPTATQARWILETPLQFKESLHNAIIHWNEGALSPKRLIPWQKGAYDIASHVFFVMQETIRRLAGAKVLRTIDDWFEVTTFATRPAHEYEEIKRWAMNLLLDEAVRVGDPELRWLDFPAHENRHELSFIGLGNRLSWFNQLLTLRESIPAAERTEAAINVQAVRWLLGTELQMKSQEVFDERANHDILRVITALVTERPDDGAPRVADPEDVRNGLAHLRRGLLRFLVVRGDVGSPLVAPRADYEALRAVASGEKLELHVVRETPSGEVVFKVVDPKKP